MDDIIRSLGQRIRQIRIQRGFKSQEQFADYCKLHRTFVGHLETGRKDFRLSSIIRVAEMLGVTMGDLFAGLEGEGILKGKVPRMSKTDSAAILREFALLEHNIKRLKQHIVPNAETSLAAPQVEKRMGRARKGDSA